MCLGVFQGVLRVGIRSNFVKIVKNTCKSVFRVKTSGYDSPRTTLRVLEEEPSIDPHKQYLGSVKPQDQSMSNRLFDALSIVSLVDT